MQKAFDLISKSALLQELENQRDMVCCQRGDFAEGYFSAMSMLQIMVEEQPTIEELKE